LLEDVIAVLHGHEQRDRPAPSVLGLGSWPPGSSSPIMMIEPADLDFSVADCDIRHRHPRA
jgi:hypothetical protein